MNKYDAVWLEHKITVKQQQQKSKWSLLLNTKNLLKKNPTQHQRHRIEEKNGLKIPFLPKTCSCLLDRGEKREGGRLVFICEVQGSLEIHKCFCIIFGYIWNARAYTKHPDILPTPNGGSPLQSPLRGSVHQRQVNVHPFFSRERRYLENGKILKGGYYSLLLH